MAEIILTNPHIAGISTCVPPDTVRNVDMGFDPGEVRKVVSMAGVQERRVSDKKTCSSDLCRQAAERLIAELDWPLESIDALIFVTQSPDYFLPSTACVAHRDLGLPDTCAAFDVGLGCSGYPYGLYIANTMLNANGMRRILLLHGETPSKFPDPEDKATVLLFGDAGSATALEYSDSESRAHYVMHTDGSGYDGLIIRGGGFRDPHPHDPADRHVHMDGAGIFNFTIKRVPKLIEDTVRLSGEPIDRFDHFIFHQSNRFIMKHLIKKAGLAEDKVPFTLEHFGNSGGASIPLTITQALQQNGSSKRLMLLGYGVGLSWASASVALDADTVLLHADYDHPSSVDEEAVG